MTNATQEAVVRKTVRVAANVEQSFKVFVEQMESWWPATHHIGSTPFVAIFVEPRAGGRWYERNAKGDLCDWGTVLKWDPPHAVAFSWHVGPGHESPEWKFDPDIARASEVEVRFTPDGANATLVQLEHRHFERHGEGYEQFRTLMDGPGAWEGVLSHYVRVIESSASQGQEHA